MKFVLSSPFGELAEIRDGRPHNGIDLAMPEGTELRSIAEGTVAHVFDGSGNVGKGVSIELKDGSHAIYGHMSDVSVKAGESLQVGDTIGLSGNTGHSSGPHLHFAIKDADGQWVDPTPVADKLAEISGEGAANFWQAKGPLTWIFESGAKDTLRENAEASFREVIYGALDALKDVLVELSYSASLIAIAVLILLQVAGWKNGGRWAGVIFVSYVLIRFLLGGLAA